MKKGLSKVIFKFTSKNENVCYKLLTKVFDTQTGEIIEKDSLITKELALDLSANNDVEIKDLDLIQEEKFEAYLAEEARQEAEAKAKKETK